MYDIFGRWVELYPRTQEIEDGVLIDVTTRAKKAGFTIPVVVTQDAWSHCVEMTEPAKKAGFTELSRLAELLAAAYVASVQEPDADAQGLFSSSAVGFPFH